MLGRSSLLILVLVGVAGCTTLERVNPFARKKPFVPTSVPADFAVVIDENHETFYTHQHIQQVITAADSTSRTTYTTFRNNNNSVSDKFTQETALTPSQLQAMWNETAKNEVLTGSHLWINWLSDADLYKRNSYTIQIRANGQSRTYQQTNGFSGPVRPVMMQVQAVRLPISQNNATPVVTAQPSGDAGAPTSRP